MAKGGVQIPAWPFAEWLNLRVASKMALAETGEAKRSVLAQVAQECGWGREDGGLRKLYRYRHMQKGTSVKVQGEKNRHRKVDITTHLFFRDVVEDALHMAGVDFYDLYIEYAHRLEGEPGRPADVLRFMGAYWKLADELMESANPWHREAYCAPCGERTMRDSAGVCHWCAGASEFQQRLKRRQQDQERWQLKAAA
jgi:hypothetical protein